MADLLNMPVEVIFRGLILPLLIIFAIIWGILSSIRVFGRKVNIILSLSITVLIATTPQFSLLVAYITQMGGNVAIVAFGILLIFGTLAWAFRSGRDIYDEAGGYSRRLMKLDEKESKLMEKYNKTGDPHKKDSIWKEVERIRRERRAVEADMRSSRY